MTTVAEPAERRTRSWRSLLGTGILGRGGLSFLVATAGVNLSNFVFHMVMSRSLGPSRYGELGSLLNLIGVLAVPIGAAQLAVTQAVVRHPAQGAARSLRRMAGLALGLGCVAMVVLWLLTPLLDGFLHLGSPLPLLLLGLWVPLAAASAVLQGTLLGEYRFPVVALATFGGGGPARLLLGVGLAAVGFGVPGAVAATIGGQLLTLVVLAHAARRELFPSGAAQVEVVRATLRDAALSIAAIGGFTGMTGIDTLLARHYFAAAPAGEYAAAAIAGHMALFLPGALVMVVFPRLAEGNATDAASRKAFGEAVLLTLALGLVAVVGIAALPGLVVTVLFGASYRPAAGIVGLLALESAILGTAGLLVYFHVARRSLAALWPWGAVAAVAGAVAIDHHSPTQLVVVMLAASVLLLGLLGVTAVGALLRAAAEEITEAIPVQALSPATLDVSLVVPFYNPGPRLGSHVLEVIDCLARSGVTFEILAVSDGSTDGSEAQLDALPPGVVRTVVLPRNLGKGAALRTGLAIGGGRYLGFIDGDGDIPAALLCSFIDTVVREQPELVYGSKRHPASQVVYPPLRRLYSWGYQWLNWLLFRLPARDTQTGVKIIRRDVVEAVLPRMVEKRFAFDLELLVVARRLGYRQLVELPVVIRERFTSTVSLRTVRAMLLDTVAIFYRMHVLRSYGPKCRSHASEPAATQQLAIVPSVNAEPSLLRFAPEVERYA